MPKGLKRLVLLTSATSPMDPQDLEGVQAEVGGWPLPAFSCRHCPIDFQAVPCCQWCQLWCAVILVPSLDGTIVGVIRFLGWWCPVLSWCPHFLSMHC